MQILDQYLPTYQFKEKHSRDIKASPAALLGAILDYRADDDPFFRAMIGLRELPSRLRLHLQGRQYDAPPPFGLHNFLLLERQPDIALAFGLIGEFWQLDYGLVPLTEAGLFLGYQAPGKAKLTLGFEVEALPGGGTRLHTETRVHCPDAVTRCRFTPYWYLIRPVSGLIRRRILARIARRATSPLG